MPYSTKEIQEQLKKYLTMITKNEFQSYVSVQMSGVTNMFDVNTVGSISGLSKAKIFDIMKNYEQYDKTFKVEENVD